MKDILIAILVVFILIGGSFFVNDTKAKHGVCCGKGCAGCKVFEETRKKNK